MASKLGLGIPQRNQKPVTKPSLDYVVVKIPLWDLKRFSRACRLLSSSMKSAGEVRSVGKIFEEMVQKANRAIDSQFSGFALRCVLNFIFIFCFD